MTRPDRNELPGRGFGQTEGTLPRENDTLKRTIPLLAGTAIGAVALFAFPAVSAPAPVRSEAPVPPLMLAQADTTTETEEERRKREEAEQQGEQPAEAAPTEELPTAEQPAEESPPPARQEEEAAEPPPAEVPPPEEPAPEATPEEAPQPEAPPAETREAEPEPTPETAPPPEPAPAQPTPEEAPVPEPQPDEPKPETRPPAGETAPADAPPSDAAPAESPPAETPPAGGTAPAEPPAGEAAPEGQPPAEAPPAEAPPAEGRTETEVLPENAAPILDSAKEEAPAGASGGGEAATPPPAASTEPAPPPPESDAAAQAAPPAEVQSATAEEGTRLAAPPPEPQRRERPAGAEVVREVGDRVVIQINNQIIVESSDRDRMTRGAREVYYEDLRGGRTRETVIRENGTRVVTIRDRYGDVLRRSRITPDGREYVLVYVEERDFEREWRDPGRDLPPMRLTIPVSEYILDAGRIDDTDDYYAFLDQPPVERVERLYGIDEVKRSARVRDKARRIDLDTLTFAFGSDKIEESEVPRLENLAEAIGRLIKENPAETFLIEGHTDAVGSDIANLALSDRRAEAVADALTTYFDIPPENLATQGYGERYLKVKTEERERLNRRVAVRRVTALVSPVASAN